MKQLTEEQAIRIAESQVWETWTNDQIVRFQLYQKRLCMPFHQFQRAIETVLGRPVWTHEFAHQAHLQAEYEGTKETPTFSEIVDMIPADKRLIIGVD